MIICSETNRHQELVVAAAKAKKHMFVEKPLGMGAKDSYAMAKAITKAGVLSYDQAKQHIRKLMEQKRKRVCQQAWVKKLLETK